MQVLVNHAARHVRSRAGETPLIVGAKGSALQLVLNSLYFTPAPPETIPFAEVEHILATHGGNPVLRWMASNVSIEQDAADNWKPSKKKSIERIDGIVALIMGLARAATQPQTHYWTPEDGVLL